MGVDLGGTKIQTVALRGQQTVGSARVPTPQSGVVEDVIQAIVETIHTALGQAKLDASAVAGVGIGSPGVIDIAAGVVSHAANVPGFSAACAWVH